MFPDLRLSSHVKNLRFRRQRGFSIITAIFLVVVLAGLGAFMLTFGTIQSAANSSDIIGSRAYHAARAGLDWGIYKVNNPETLNGFAVGVAPYDCTGLAAGATAIGNATNFTVSVQCSFTSTPPIEGTNNWVRFYTITATAQSSSSSVGNASYVERQLTATISTCRVGAGSTINC